MKLSNINFKGYSNILCACNVPVSNKNVSYLAMQLNNDDGYCDLDKYKEVRNLQGYPANERNGDILIFSLIRSNNKNEDNVILGTKSMYWGDELKQIEEKYVPSVISEDKFLKERSIQMKVYTLLAGITKRLSNESFNKQNSDLYRVIEHVNSTFNNIKINDKILFNPSTAFNLTNIGCLNETKFQLLSSAFNKLIAGTMSHYFR